MNETAARALVRLRAAAGDPGAPDVCEGCGAHRGESYAHRLRRSQGGPWSPSNALRLCGDGTVRCHGWSSANPDAAKAQGWELRGGQDPERVPVLIFAAGLWRAWWLLLPDGGYEWVRDVDPAELVLPLDAAIELRDRLHAQAVAR